MTGPETIRDGGGQVKPVDAETVLWFGKHKGKTVGAVLADAPGYLVWANGEVGTFKLPAAILSQALARSESRRIQQAYVRSFGRFGDDNDWGGLTEMDFQS